MTATGPTAHFTPITGDIMPTTAITTGATADRQLASLVSKLQHRLDMYQQQVANAASTTVDVPSHAHHHSRTTSGNGSYGGGARRGVGGTPDEVSFVLSVGEPAAPHVPGQGPVQGDVVVPAAPSDVVRVRPRGGSTGYHSPRSHHVSNEERALWAAAEELCTALNGGVNYRVLCEQYAVAMEAITTMVRQDIAMLRSSVVLPQCAVVKASEELHALLGESARLLKDAGVVDLTNLFAGRRSETAGRPADATATSAPTAADLGKPPVHSAGTHDGAHSQITSTAPLSWQPSALEEELSHHQALNRVNTAPYMRALAQAGKAASGKEMVSVSAAADGAAIMGSRSDIGSSTLVIDGVVNFETVAAPDDTQPVVVPGGGGAGERSSSPPPHAVALSSNPTPRHQPHPPTTERDAPLQVSRFTGSAASAPRAGSVSPATAVPMRRLRRLEQLFGEAYTHDSDQFIQDVLGVVFRYQYDAAVSPLEVAQDTWTGVVPSQAGTIASMNRSRRASTDSANTSPSVAPTADTLARFRDFKQHTSHVVASLTASYEALREGSFDSTPIRSDYVYQCLLARTKPHETILAALDDVRDDRSVEVLNLDGARIGDAAVAPLLLLLPRLYRLHTLNLQQCDLHDETVAMLVSCARAHPTLRSINLSRNDVTDAAFDDIVALYVTVPKIETVALTGCPLSPNARTELDAVRSAALSEAFGQRHIAVRQELGASTRLVPVRPRSALHSYAALKSTARRNSLPRRGHTPYAPFAAKAPTSGVYANTASRGGSQPPVKPRRGSGERVAVAASLPPIRPF